MNRWLVLFLLATVVSSASLQVSQLNGTVSEEEELTHNLREHALQLRELVDIAVPEMNLASQMLNRGICAFKGFCDSNPASSCQEILTQRGVTNRTALPDGQYWLTAQKRTTDGFEKNLPFKANCVLSLGGWMVLFDDTGKHRVEQAFDKHVSEVLVKEFMAFTVDDIRQGKRETVPNYLYNVDVTHPDHRTSFGFTANEMINAQWAGQDNYGKTIGGRPYPFFANHFRYKFFGQPQVKRSQTLFVLDDGDIGSECKPQQGGDTCFYNDENSRIAQTCVTSKGLISFGCSDSEDDFTSCGTCVYSSGAPKADVIHRSVVQKLLVR